MDAIKRRSPGWLTSEEFGLLGRRQFDGWNRHNRFGGPAEIPRDLRK